MVLKTELRSFPLPNVPKLASEQPPTGAPKSSYGFNMHGKYIGCNTPYPYPFQNPHYHRYNFHRCADYMCVPVRDDRDLDNKERRRKFEEKQGEPIPHHLMDDDMQMHIQLTNERLAKKEQKEVEKAARQCVPQHIKDLPGHRGPSCVQLTSQMYGQYLDLQTPGLPYPCVPVSPRPMLIKNEFRYSNMSDHAPIPTHAFCVSPESLMSADGTHYQRGLEGAVHQPTPKGQAAADTTSFLTSQINTFGGVVGERVPGHTWPQYTRTGLELHRPLRRCVGVVEGPHEGGNSFTEKLSLPSKVPHIYNRYQRSTCDPDGDPETEVNPADVHHRKLCAPHAGYASNRKSPQDNPCHDRFNQGESFLPTVVSHKKRLLACP